MAGHGVRAWVLRLLLVVGAAGAVVAMHSLPVASHDHADTHSTSAMQVTMLAGGLTGHRSPDPDPKHHGIEHLCLAVVTVVTVVAGGIALAAARRRWRTGFSATATRCEGRGERSPPPRRPPSLSQLCVLRL